MCFKMFIDTFSSPSCLVKPDNNMIKVFEKLVPHNLIHFWQEYGFGNYANGFVKVINPLEYMDSLYQWLGKKDTSRIPVLISAFGDIFYYRKFDDDNEDVSVLSIHYRNIDVCVWSLTDFFNSYIIDNNVVNNILRKRLFDEAVSKKGCLENNEIYYFVPALIAGGKEDIQFIDKGDAVTHQSILFQMGA